MLTDTEILAVPIGELAARLSPEAQIVLSNLVKRSSEYKSKVAVYGSNIKATIKATVDAAIAQGATPEQIALARALAAVVAKLKTLPPFMVESEGSRERPMFFSTNNNLEELAQDVLGVLYEDTPEMAQVFAVVTRKMYDECGMVWANPGELYFATRNSLRLY